MFTQAWTKEIYKATFYLHHSSTHYAIWRNWSNTRGQTGGQRLRPLWVTGQWWMVWRSLLSSCVHTEFASTLADWCQLSTCFHCVSTLWACAKFQQDSPGPNSEILLVRQEYLQVGEGFLMTIGISLVLILRLRLSEVPTGGPKGYSSKLRDKPAHRGRMCIHRKCSALSSYWLYFVIFKVH